MSIHGDLPGVDDERAARVLYVDGDRETAEAARAAIEADDGLEARVSVVPGVGAALDAVEDGGVECVVSAHDLPDGTGVELLAAVRRDHPDLPFFLVAAAGSESVAAESIGHDVTGYLRASELGEDFGELVDRVRREIRSGRVADRAERVRRYYRSLVERAPWGVAVVDEDDRYVCASRSLERTLGDDASSLVGTTPFDHVHPEDHDRFERALGAVEDAGASDAFEYRVRDPEGWRWFEAVVVDQRDDAVGGRVVYSREVTERKERERELAATREELQALIDAAPLPIISVDEDDRVETWNPAAERVFGWSREEVIGEPLPTIPEDRSYEHEGIRREVFEGDSTDAFETVRRTKEGDMLDVRLWTAPNRDPDGEVGGAIGILEDVTERRRRERERQRYEATIETVPDGVYVFDEQYRFETVNEALVEMTGYDRSKLIGAHASLVFDESAVRAGERLRAEMQAGDADDAVLETEITRADGGTVPCELHGRLFPTSGEGDRTAGVIRDISERRRRERALERSERRYRTLVEMSPDPILVHADGEILFANEALARLVGVDDAEGLVGTSITDYLPSEEREDAVEVARKTQRGEMAPTSYDREMTTVDGERRYIATTSRPIVYEDESAVLTIVKAGSERHQYRAAVESLHEHTREMFRQETPEEVARVAVRAAEDLLGTVGATVFGFDESENALVAVAQSERERAELWTAAPIGPEDGGVVWDVFVDGERRYVPDAASHDGVPDRPVTDALYVPLGSHGLLSTASTTAEGLSETSVELCSILATNLEAALTSVERRTRLRDQERRLQRQTEELAALDRLNGIIREINRSLFEATTREEIRAAVCRELTAQEPYTAAWIGERTDGDGVVPVTVEHLDAGHAGAVEGAGASPLFDLAAAALSAGELRTADDVLDDPEWASLRETALQYDYRSVAAVPIPIESEPDEVLVVHVAESAPFTDDERVVFGDLGEMIGQAMAALGTTRGQVAPVETELAFEIGDDRLLLNRVARALGTAVRLRGAVPVGADSLVTFLEVESVDDGVRETIEGLHGVASVETLTVEADTALYRVTGERTALFDLLYDHGARLTALSTDGETASVTVQLPESGSVRGIAEDVAETFPDSELLARRSEVSEETTPMTVHAAVREACTDRQYEALRAAFYGGYYEWPRAATNEDLASALDIASPTYQSHRRAAERVVMATLFEGTA